MKTKSIKFKGLKVIQGKSHIDYRGAFRELFLKKKNKGFSGIFGACLNQKKM